MGKNLDQFWQNLAKAEDLLIVVNPKLPLSESVLLLAIYSAIKGDNHKKVDIYSSNQDNIYLDYLFSTHDIIPIDDVKNKTYIIAVDYSDDSVDSISWDVKDEKVLVYIEPANGKDFDYNRIKYSEQGGAYQAIMFLGFSNWREVEISCPKKVVSRLATLKSHGAVSFLSTYDKGKVSLFYNDKHGGNMRTSAWIDHLFLRNKLSLETIQSLALSLRLYLGLDSILDKQNSPLVKTLNKMLDQGLTINELLSQARLYDLPNSIEVKREVFNRTVIDSETKIVGAWLDQNAMKALKLDEKVVLTNLLPELWGQDDYDLLFLGVELEDKTLFWIQASETYDLNELLAEADQYWGDSSAGVVAYKDMNLAQAKSEFLDLLQKANPLFNPQNLNSQDSEEIENDENGFKNIPISQDF